MPELPEVETVRRQLSETLIGKKIKKIEVSRTKSFNGDPDKLIDWQVEKVGRKAKIIEIYFKNKKDMLIVHLKMTGQLVFVDGDKRVVGGHPTADWVKDLPSKHTRVTIGFVDGSSLFFNDMRVFGWIKLTNKEKYEKGIKSMAPDVTENEFSLDYLSKILKNSRRAIKLILMDQTKIGGVGNIYANDALYLAKVRPDRKANSLTSKETKKIYEGVKEVIAKGIKYGGASAANYVDTKGMGGTYQDHFLVYKKEGQRCKKCGEKIQKIKIGGRGTFYCPVCQK
ncbi:MAG TPA: bifunctional DNA-formamidopyrimidine glycosylase/DNA-(apurinic or apyrimidinic site) lyase [Candidatus Woesebacteria bacterium]|nr:bifunctional DNA-formamidopyrimidine glycosylase/DNA-(apurinic or apyrimidinic site) lyase [Candidatus Woesebacteria bacterium]